MNRVCFTYSESLQNACKLIKKLIRIISEMLVESEGMLKKLSLKLNVINVTNICYKISETYFGFE
ncbi:hypothetical protein BpHYR1_054395 [Brachionus plicatilis]|uniref:Uncharacterized protein n=1 Tax=Brachionus plicatilis TaxID=10195 RepID=A0A3M7QI25_BRAPC|nr:hypothetical protein BpHYR1_054395 [Brachionus plicatilis]